MERHFEKWYEVSYQKMVYGPIHTEDKKFHYLEEAYDCADEIKGRFPNGQVWIMECKLEKKEVEQ